MPRTAPLTEQQPLPGEFAPPAPVCAVTRRDHIWLAYKPYLKDRPAEPEYCVGCGARKETA
jgi:hypothetical protein